MSRDRLTEAVDLMARIRQHGQWESAQTHASLLPYLVEESWEFIDAVADGDRDELVAELGDLLLQVLFHAAIGAERTDGAFDVQDVAGSLLDKLRRRAPYWFDDDDTDAAANADAADAAAPTVAATDLDAAEQDRLWQEAKAAERAGRPPRGVVEGLAWGMPALALGQKVLARARAAGIPDDLVPAEMRVVRVDPAGGSFSGAGSAAEVAAAVEVDSAAEVAAAVEVDSAAEVAAAEVDTAGAAGDESGSAEVAYRGVVRRFADSIRAAESALPVPAGEATPAHWRAAWRS